MILVYIDVRAHSIDVARQYIVTRPYIDVTR